jgi:hypothetical protein
VVCVIMNELFKSSARARSGCSTRHSSSYGLLSIIKFLPWISGCVKDVCDDARLVIDVQMFAISFKSGLGLATCAVANGALWKSIFIRFLDDTASLFLHVFLIYLEL